MPPPISNSAETLQGTRTRWFFRGMAIGLLAMASINAVSYFVRSDDWSSLVGPPESNQEAIGFPWIIWEAGNQYGGFFADYPNLALNLLVAVVVGATLGLFVSIKGDFFNRVIDCIDQQNRSHDGNEKRRKSSPIQFSVQGLMITTTIVAITVAIVSQVAASPTTLICIYALGPVALVTLAMIPRRLSWQHRVVLLIPITFGLIAIAILVGNSLQMEFDKVLMGIFLSWTPQSALAAIGLTAWIMATNSKTET